MEETKMVKIRLKRMGGHKKPFYRIVVANSRRARDGKFIEEIGYFNPLTDPDTIKVNAEAATKWMENGAQLSERVRSIFKKEGIIQ